jgi:hypothetical protein
LKKLEKPEISFDEHLSFDLATLIIICSGDQENKNQEEEKIKDKK